MGGDFEEFCIYLTVKYFYLLCNFIVELMKIDFERNIYLFYAKTICTIKLIKKISFSFGEKDICASSLMEKFKSLRYFSVMRIEILYRELYYTPCY